MSKNVVDDSNPFDPVREHEAAVEAVADRDDRLGAAARVALALARDERPSDDDLETAGFPTYEDMPAATPNGEEGG